MSDAQTDSSIDDEAAVDDEQLVRDNIGWMLVLAERLLRDHSLAEDVVQESFLRAFDNLHGFEGRSSFKTWLHRITVNVAISKLRSLDRLAEHSLDEYLPEFDLYDCRVEMPWSKLATIDEAIESEENRRRVLEAIRQLPDSYRIVLELRDIEEYDTREVASLLGISTSNAKVRLHRARSALKKLLEPMLRGEDSQ